MGTPTRRTDEQRDPRPRHRRTIALLTAKIVLVAAVGIGGGIASVAAPASVGAAPDAVDDHDWLGIVNSYRAMSGLDPVVENPTWSAEAREHSRYMLLNGITHHQTPGNPGYSEAGHRAGSNGNVATSSSATATPRRFVDLWMTGPFHAIGLLRHQLTATGFGMASDPDTSPWRSGATLDVLRGLQPGTGRTVATVFPGRDATVPLDRFVAEYPDPVRLVGWTGPAGLPLFSMMTRPVTRASATLVGPQGALEVRVLHPGDAGSGPGADLARQVMAGDNVVVIVPRDPLAPGRYTATVTTDGGDVSWRFTVDPDAPLRPAPPPVGGAAPGSIGPISAQDAAPDAAPAAGGDGPSTRPLARPAGYVPTTPFRLADSRAGRQLVRLPAGTTVPLAVGGADHVAASINVTIDRPAGPGFVTVQGTDVVVPTVSTVNFGARPAANHVVAPIVGGRIGLHASVDTDVIVDVNGYFVEGGGVGFVPTAPGRVFDTRESGVRLSPGEPRRIPVVGVPGGAPAGAQVVALNLTMVDAAADGYLAAWPTGVDRVEVSNVNVAAGETRPNSALVAVGPDGSITVESSVGSHLLVDVTGHLLPPEAGGALFTPVDPIRLLDTRSGAGPTAGARLGGGASVAIPVAGRRGVPADARAVWVNVTAVEPARAGYVTVHPGDTAPNTSTLNTHPNAPAVANGALVALGPDGTLTVHADHDVHVLVDLMGVWS